MKGPFASCLAAILVLSSCSLEASAFVIAPQRAVSIGTSSSSRQSPLAALGTQERQSTEKSGETSVEETTEKYGLEAGLFKSLQNEDGGESAKSLLKKYGIAYLATSIPLAIVSFAICYLLVDNGVDVGSLLSKVGNQSGDATEKAGTFAIAYAAHKAASPIRFPPTVILTPVVAKMIGKEPEEEAAP
eukprot:CAMPEP_0172442904 /NCGR_PEP_ID=MMETSP1065-20121228/3258_1 /TAXON_ID=265537 /ORGANISM="Amphiprora paludosa, Strain CCMP125" /LENGTH=187 /DNA_ID=CAMNT_0013192949 /DNA_START=71 /DNA_END=634 /DNA_ORIENTATION=+